MKTLATHRRHPAAVVAVIVVGLVVTGVSYGIAASATEARSADDPVLAAQVQIGKRLYLEGCSSCHGLAAQGTANGPTLIGVGAAAVDFQMATGRMPLANPGPQAPAKPPDYNETQIAQIAAYIASLAPGPEIPTAEELDYSDADIAVGGELFRANCSQCHQAAGRGGALSNGKYAPNLMESTPTAIWEAMLSGPQSMPIFANSTMPAEDKQAILAYVHQLQTGEDPGGWSLGRFGPVTEGLFAWIGGLLLAVACAVWIGSRIR